MTYKENITAILECHFGGFKEEIIDSACNSILEIEPCEYAPFTIDELKNEDMQKLLREFKNQRVIVTDHDCLPSATIIEPCEDAISRAWLKEAIHNFYYGLKHKPTEEDIQAYIDSAKPVTPKSKTGHWILLDECSNSGYYCSECHKKVIKEGWSNTVKKIKYCPNCGARMEEPQESEGKE